VLAGDVRVLDDVPKAYARIVADEIEASRPRRTGTPFRLAASGGASGSACCGALADFSAIDFTSIDLFFVDERCVEAGSPDLNSLAISDALGQHRASLAGFHAMSCSKGAASYAEEIRHAGGLDLVQLGLGPDGHTASLFVGSAALDEHDALVCSSVDPSGRNAHERLTLTYPAISLAPLVVIAVIGQARAEVVRAVADGGDYPIARVRAQRLVWLIDTAAATLLEGMPYA